MLLERDFPNHWKTDALVDLAGDEQAVRCLLRLWCHCEDRKRWVFDYDPVKLERVCGWAKIGGESRKFYTALEQCGWIDVSEDGKSFTVHEWADVNAGLVKQWVNGRSGGRPKNPTETQKKPSDNPTETQKKPSDNPTETQKKPSDNPTETQKKPSDNPTETQANPSVTDRRIDRGIEGRKDGARGRAGAVEFKPPTLAEWLAYAQEVGWTDRAKAEEAFWSLDAGGWRRGKARTPYANWRSALQTCFARWKGDRGDNENPPRVPAGPRGPRPAGGGFAGGDDGFGAAEAFVGGAKQKTPPAEVFKKDEGSR